MDYSLLFIKSKIPKRIDSIIRMPALVLEKAVDGSTKYRLREVENKEIRKIEGKSNNNLYIPGLTENHSPTFDPFKQNQEPPSLQKMKSELIKSNKMSFNNYNR